VRQENHVFGTSLNYIARGREGRGKRKGREGKGMERISYYYANTVCLQRREKLEGLCLYFSLKYKRS
jgi:hypothetical protein